MSITSVGFVISLWNLKSPKQRKVPVDFSVDVWIPTYNEDIDLLRKTIIACKNIEYPHKTFVLDDGNRLAVKELAENLNVGYIARKKNLHAKAGNLNNALKHSNADFIAIFDADTIPMKKYLSKLLGYFKDPGMGLVQAPQYYYNLNSIQFQNKKRKKKLWNEQESFFNLVLEGRNHWNAVFWVGTNAIIRREAIDSIGGFATGSLIEDMHTSIKLHSKKWKSLYIKIPLAFGMAPAHLSQFIIQRLRWAQGAAQLMRKINPLFIKGLTFVQRICYLSSITHFFEGIAKAVYYILPASFLLWGIIPVKNSITTILIIQCYFLLSILLIFIIAKNRISFIREEIFSMLRFFYYLIGSMTFFYTKKNNFKVTPKNDQHDFSFKLIIGPVFVFCLNAAAIFSQYKYFTYFSLESSLETFLLIFCIGWSFYFILISISVIYLVFSMPLSDCFTVYDSDSFIEVKNNSANKNDMCITKYWNETIICFWSRQEYTPDKILSFKLHIDENTNFNLMGMVAYKKTIINNNDNKLYEYILDVKIKERAVYDQIITAISQIPLERQFAWLCKNDSNDPAAALVKYKLATAARIKVKKIKSIFNPLDKLYRLLQPRRIPQLHIFTEKIIIIFVISIIFYNIIDITKYSYYYYQNQKIINSAKKAKKDHINLKGFVSKNGYLHVNGVQLYNMYDKPVQLRGISSHGIQWYPFVQDNTIPNMVKTFNINVLRIAMYIEDYKHGDFWNGYLAQPDYMKYQTNCMIREAINQDIYVILSWHIHNDPMKFYKESLKFFKEMSRQWGSYPNIIFEICNEPEGNIPWERIRKYAIGNDNNPEDGIIDIIRKHDPDSYENIIIVGTPFWSQHPHKVLNAPIINQKNIMYSLHFYAAEHKQEARDFCMQAYQAGLPIFASEWGASDYTTKKALDYYETYKWINLLNRLKISWVTWSLSTKDEMTSILNSNQSMAGPWDVDDLSESGVLVKRLIRSK